MSKKYKLHTTVVFNKIMKNAEVRWRIVFLLLKKQWEFKGAKLIIDKKDKISITAKTNDKDIMDVELVYYLVMLSKIAMGFMIFESSLNLRKYNAFFATS